MHLGVQIPAFRSPSMIDSDAVCAKRSVGFRQGVAGRCGDAVTHSKVRGCHPSGDGSYAGTCKQEGGQAGRKGALRGHCRADGRRIAAVWSTPFAPSARLHAGLRGRPRASIGSELLGFPLQRWASDLAGRLVGGDRYMLTAAVLGTDAERIPAPRPANLRQPAGTDVRSRVFRRGRAASLSAACSGLWGFRALRGLRYSLRARALPDLGGRVGALGRSCCCWPQPSQIPDRTTAQRA